MESATRYFESCSSLRRSEGQAESGVCGAATWLEPSAAALAAHQAATADRSEGLALERQLVMQIRATEDFMEGARAFAQKRPPQYKGK